MQGKVTCRKGDKMKVEPIYYGEYTNYLCQPENEEERQILLEMAKRLRTPLDMEDKTFETFIEELDQLNEEGKKWR